MITGYFFLLLALTGFGILGIFAKVADSKACRPSAVYALLYFWSLVFVGIFLILTKTPATGTPATDGKRVYVYFGSFGMLCYDFEGKERWRKVLPVPVTVHGPGTSPVVAGDRVILEGIQRARPGTVVKAVPFGAPAAAPPPAAAAEKK